MIKPWPGSGNKNKAEALYLLKGHEPRHRKGSDTGSSEAWERENYPPMATGNSQWDESMRRIQARDLRSTFETDKQLTVSDEEVTALLGPAPRVEDLPDWIREAIATEDGGLAARERCWPGIQQVRAPYELRRYPWLYGAIYGLLRYHSLTRDINGHRRTWVSVARLAEEAGYSIRRVESILRDIERLGMISTEMRPGQSSLYTLLLDEPGRVGQAYNLVEKKSGLYVVTRLGAFLYQAAGNFCKLDLPIQEGKQILGTPETRLQPKRIILRNACLSGFLILQTAGVRSAAGAHATAAFCETRLSPEAGDLPRSVAGLSDHQ